MISTAKGKYIRTSPTKIRQVIDLIRGKDVSSAQAVLTHLAKGSTQVINKILASAVNNAEQKGLTQEQLFISKIHADQGRTEKRFRAAAFGRATGIRKKSTHLTIELDLIA